MDHFPKRPALDLAFQDVTFSVTSWNRLRIQKKNILHGVSGAFKAGELTAIMGPSGAGKTTLLNILAGFIQRGSGGVVSINGRDRREVGLEQFKSVSCYIQQEDEVRSKLTVLESMMLATHLKLGCTISHQDKQQKIIELLEMLGLSQNCNTYSGKLSGGQKKRLSIALELITNPPIIFLDEPTTGLDSSSMTSCVTLIRELAVRQGRTVICTIHQPSALIFEQFSHLYCVAEGRTIYQGKPSHLTEHFLDHGLRCPPYHNPADFLIEVAVGEYGFDMKSIAESAEKEGQLRASAAIKKIPPEQWGLEMFRGKGKHSSTDLPGINSCLPQPAPLWIQAFHLYNRNVLALRRNMTQILLRFIAHLAIALVFGYLYRDVGNDANTLFANYIYVYGTNLFLHYTAQMAVLLSFPLEYKVLSREHFNRWYSLAPYCMALIFVEVPFQMTCAMIYMVPSYYMTGQPLEWMRFVSFVVFNLAITYTAQSTGFLAGATCPVTIAVFIAPVVSVFLSVFGFANKYEDLPSMYHIGYNISYFRATFHGSFSSLYSYNRSDLPCHQFYCHYKKPEKFLKEMGFADYEPVSNLCWIIIFGSVTYMLTVVAVWFRLNKR